MKYKHDCTECIPLGEFNDTDLYFCDKGFEPTVISRRSNEPSDYCSGMYFAKPDGISELYEAKMRAIKQGHFIKGKEL